MKRFLAILLSLVLVVAFSFTVGCKKAEPPVPAKPAEAPKPAVAPPPEAPAPAPEKAPEAPKPAEPAKKH